MSQPSSASTSSSGLLQQPPNNPEDEKILPTHRPKNLREGVAQGVGNIVGAAVGAAGVAVLMPVAGASMGVQRGGFIGGVLGFGGGAVAGVFGAAGIAVAGAFSGVVQVGRGVAAVPQQMVAPLQGKWWNENEGRWVLTHMEKEAQSLEGIPADDGDILGRIRADLDQGGHNTDQSLSTTHNVVDTILYDALEVPPDADQSTIKRRYYILARKYHPDKQPDDNEAAEKFKVVSEAYHILSDPEMREKYNKMGRDSLQNDPNHFTPTVDPKVLFAFLFGSDKFQDIIGHLATATSASVGDSDLVTHVDARKLQKRRVTRLAIKLIQRIDPYVRERESGGTTPNTEEDGSILQAWKQQAQDLCKASFGYPLVKAIGEAYYLMAAQYQGSIESGQGLPSLSKWASGKKAALDKRRAAIKNRRKQVFVGIQMADLQSKLNQAMETAETDEERAKLSREAEETATEMMVRALWTTTVVDITSTLYETCQMVFFDQSVDKSVRKNRAKAVAQ